MSQFKINSITDRSGYCGPVISGVSTNNSTGCMIIPAGPTSYRGGRGRGIFASGYTPNATRVIDAIEVASTGDAIDWGDLITTGGAFMGGASNNNRGVYAGAFDGNDLGNRLNTIQALTMPTNGDIFDFGDLTYTTQQSTGAGNETRGVYTSGYSYPLAPTTDAFQQTFYYINFATTGKMMGFGDIPTNASSRSMNAIQTQTRGFFCGGEGTYKSPSVQNRKITEITFATQGSAITFGELSGESKGGASMESHTRAVVVLGGDATSPEAFKDTIEYFTMATRGNTTDFGNASSNTGAINDNAATNRVRGVYHNARTSDGGSNKNILEYVTIASTGNATDFGDLTSTRNSGCGLSDTHGGLHE